MVRLTLAYHFKEMLMTIKYSYTTYGNDRGDIFTSRLVTPVGVHSLTAREMHGYTFSDDRGPILEAYVTPAFNLNKPIQVVHIGNAPAGTQLIITANDPTDFGHRIWQDRLGYYTVAEIWQSVLPGKVDAVLVGWLIKRVSNSSETMAKEIIESYTQWGLFQYFQTNEDLLFEYREYESGWIAYTGIDDLPLKTPLILEIENQKVVFGMAAITLLDGKSTRICQIGDDFDYIGSTIKRYRIAEFLLPGQQI